MTDASRYVVSSFLSVSADDSSPMSGVPTPPPPPAQTSLRLMTSSSILNLGNFEPKQSLIV